MAFVIDLFIHQSQDCQSLYLVLVGRTFPELWGAQSNNNDCGRGCKDVQFCSSVEPVINNVYDHKVSLKDILANVSKCGWTGAAKSSPIAKPGSTSSRPSSAKKAAPTPAVKSDRDLETQVTQLNEQVHSLKLALEGVEKERDFYFGKLREIELLCQAHGQEGDDLVQRLMEVLYAAEEQEGHTDQHESEEQDHVLEEPQQQEEY
ncbi:microtubule-associated RP EB family member 2 isoform X3 [Pelobates cultripes]|uniref:Microtubule-associated RP EB family member 2 isoform X3 n=1 Tax=Pelobates cultripes TaxID=61616 RepID=A0AAD1W5A9_PELCU|nr:microtubule-associated RP EB family member 2 isoform X3 [Pelobates cultripes]